MALAGVADYVALAVKPGPRLLELSGHRPVVTQELVPISNCGDARPDLLCRREIVNREVVGPPPSTILSPKKAQDQAPRRSGVVRRISSGVASSASTLAGCCWRRPGRERLLGDLRRGLDPIDLHLSAPLRACWSVSNLAEKTHPLRRGGAVRRRIHIVGWTRRNRLSRGLHQIGLLRNAAFDPKPS